MDILIITKNLLPVNPYSRSGEEISDVRGLVYHYTGGAPGSSAQQQRDYFATTCIRNERYAGAHFFIGVDGEIIQAIPTDEVAYHCGAKAADYAQTGKALGLSPQANFHNIGVEMCHKAADGSFSQATLKSAQLLGAYLSRQFNIEPRRIVRHYDITGKICPLYFVDNEPKWDQFKSQIQKYKELVN